MGFQIALPRGHHVEQVVDSIAGLQQRRCAPCQGKASMAPFVREPSPLQAQILHVACS